MNSGGIQEAHELAEILLLREELFQGFRVPLPGIRAKGRILYYTTDVRRRDQGHVGIR